MTDIPPLMGSPARAIPWRAHYFNNTGGLFETFEWASSSWYLVITGVDAVGQSSGADVQWTFALQPVPESIFGALAATSEHVSPIGDLVTFTWRGALPLRVGDQVSIAVDGDVGNSATLWGYLLPFIDTGAAWVP